MGILVDDLEESEIEKKGKKRGKSGGGFRGVQLKQDVACKYFHGNCLKGPKSYAIIGSFLSSTYFLTARMHSFAVLRSCKLD